MLRIVFFLGFSLSLSAFQANAQSCDILDPVTTVTGTLAELGTNGELVVDWDVQNTSSNAIYVRARRVIVSAVQGSENYFCWGVCYNESTNESPLSPVDMSQLMEPGAINNTFYAHYRPNNLAGQTVIAYCFFDRDNTADEVCHEVNFCVDTDCVVGVEEMSTPGELGEIYPNPLSGLGKLEYRFSSPQTGATMTIYSLLGEKVKEVALTGQEGLVLLHGGDFANGTYVVTLSANGQVFDSTTLVVAH